ncbi:MAG: glycine--tRNA ligase subunit beta [Candidatus Brocadiia bacterium]
MTDFLLELGCEEIPAGYINPALEHSRKYLAGYLGEKRLNPGQITALASPRRLAFFVPGLPDAQEDINKEILGPSVTIAFDHNNDPTAALYGFSKKNNVQPHQVKIKDSPKGKICYLQISIKGEKTEKLLADAVAGLVKSIPFPKSMWWLASKEGGKSLTFARPLRYILAVFGAKTLKIELSGVASAKTSAGHPFYTGKPVDIKSSDPAKYKDALRKARVIVDPAERKDIILKGIRDIAQKCDAVCDEPALLDEVTHLVEFPSIIECSFDESFLKIPSAVIESAMKSHQRYFPLKDSKGKLLPRFVVVSNNPNNSPLIKEGNERVLRARLADAVFFWENDRKIPLSEYAQRLESITFLGKLGTMKEKSARLKELSVFLTAELNCQAAEKTAARAAELCKADLMTGMVGEFPDLQGIMGYEYLKDSEPGVALAIKEHYQPRFAGDALPQTPAGICLSLAEKFDNLAACFISGLIPTGSNDQYGLRRQVLGIINIVVKNNLSLSLGKVWKKILPLLVETGRPKAPELAKSPYPGAQSFWTNVAKAGNPSDADIQAFKTDITKFIEQRCYQMAVEDDAIPHEIFNAVIIPHGIDNLIDRYQRIRTLHKLSQEPIWGELVEVVERTHNIAKGASSTGGIDESLLKEKEEQELYAAYKDNKDQIAQLSGRADYEAASRLFHKTFAQLAHTFFDKVFVNVEDKALRDNRIALNRNINRLYFDNIADLSQIPRKKY